LTQRVLDPNGPHQWFNPTSWVGGIIPQSGDTVLLSNDGVSLGSDLVESGATPSIQNVTIDMQGNASIGGYDVTLERDVVINVEDNPNASGFPTATWGANGTTIFRGALNLAAPQGTFDISISGQLGAGNLINAGVINLTNGMHVDISASTLAGLTNSGTITINGHSSFVNEGPLAGQGTIQIEDGSLTLDGGTDVNPYVVFGDGPGQLVLDGTKSGIWGLVSILRALSMASAMGTRSN
jgi:hypothetical protein